ncbi:folylpolyglutamate synthase/dihydrofolate synthase family protein [Bacillota bacterium LX-D]|nr:folylpolyglutamate synthase/dihydrofolate synthase family protein [Bacillota bacterium LX-D]
MNFPEALEYITELTKFGWNPGLARIEKLMEILDHPEKSLKVIHVTGTNGKGSTSAMISNILQAAGYKVGLFTSPHLHTYTERIQINGAQIPEERMAQLVTALKPNLEKMVAEGFEHPTEFEVITALALLYFAQEQIDFCVLEVGLGGAIDSTNVVQPLVAVITNIAMDHMDYLGNTLGEIAKVKAGIIKPGCKAITASDQAEALSVIREVCAEKNVDLYEVGKDIIYQIKNLSSEGTCFDLKGLGRNYVDLWLPLIGSHQGRNGAAAIAAVEALSFFDIQISEEAIREGLQKTIWPGRLELVRKNPQILIDAAHNLEGALSLQRAIKEIFHYKNLVFVLGMLADKEREKVLDVLGPLAQKIVITKPNSPRANNWEELALMAQKYTEDVYRQEDIAQAVEKGISLTGPEDLLCITGSIYMIAEARAYLLSKTD